MSSITFYDTVTHVPADWANDTDKLVYAIFGAAQSLAEARTRLGLKAMAFQDSAQVSISGGAIDGVAIGIIAPVSQIVAQKAIVIDAPISGSDVVNLDAMASYVSLKLTDSASAFTGGLGSLAFQNKNNISVTGGLIDNVDIGTQGRASGAFTTLKASNPPSDGDDTVTLGWLTQHYDVRLNAVRSMAYQDALSVDILGGEINGVAIGLTTPVTLRVLRGTIVTAPSNNEDLTNKRYVDGSISAFASTLGSMAFQNNYAVNITGGTVDGVGIGANVTAAGRFNALAVVANQSILRLKTTSTAVENKAGIQFQDTADVASLVYYGAGSSVNASTLQLTSAVPIRIATSGASIGLTNVNTTISGLLVTLGASSSNQIVVGSGSTVVGMKLTAHDKVHLDYVQSKRSMSFQGQSKKIDQTYADNAVGICPINVNLAPAFEINVKDNVAIVLMTDDGDWPVGSIRSIEILLLLTAGGKNVAFPVEVQWGSQSAPDYSYTKAGDFDIVRLHTKNGVTWYGESVYSTNTSYARLPSISFFAVEYGTTSKFAWHVKDAGSINITGIGPVSVAGSHTFTTPTVETTYTLTAVGNDGRVTTASVTIHPVP